MFKNRGLFSDLSLWDDFVSSLLYPAILGSLIYEFTNFHLNIKYIFLLITLAFYVVDYFYLHYAYKEYIRKSDKKLRTPSMIRLDFVVAFLFAVIILSINKIFSTSEPSDSPLFCSIISINVSYYFVILLSTLGIFIVACIYINDKDSNNVFILLIINTIIIFSFRLLIISCSKCHNCYFEAFIYLILVILYTKVALDDYYNDPPIVLDK